MLTRNRSLVRYSAHFFLWFLSCALAGSRSFAESGISQPVPSGPYFNGVFPSTVPGSTTGIDTANAFPNLRFIGPVWLTEYPGTDDLVVTSKAGHIWRFENRPDVTPDDVTVMLNFSKYAGKGVDWPANVLPDATNEPTVSRTEKVISSVSFAIFNISFHPDFGQSGHPHENHVYISYMPRPSDIAVTENQNYFRVSRFTIVNDPADGPVIDPTSEQILINQFNGNRNHEGGAMFFGDDGFLWITHGDGGFGGGYEHYGNVTSQRLDGTLKGGILRIDVDMQGGGISHPIRRQPDDTAMTANAVPPAGWPASSTGNYYIPSDNPWVDPSPTSDVLEEFWAIGLRSPHTMQQDPTTGDIWIGDVGGNREEIHLAAKAANFGWRDINGDHPPAVPYFGTNSPAILTISRSISTSVIGGYVYRDSEFPSLQGKLIFGDNVKNNIFAMTYSPGQPASFDQIASRPTGNTWTGMANFCRGPNGELFITEMGGYDDATKIEDNDGTIQRLVPVSTSPDAPALLSQTGAFLNLETLDPHPSFVPFGVLAPLWSDNSAKSRWISVPNDGTHDTPSEKITFSENDNWTFPAGTVLMKHFELPNDETDPSSTVRLETRFIICTDGGGKYGVTYRWLPDQSDAVLLTVGETGDYQIAESGGGSRIQTWAFPSRDDCLLCHNDASGQALGVRTHQLNGFYPYPGSELESHQLLTWSHLGMFDQSLTQSQVDDFIQARGLTDAGAPLEHRVRSYLDSNCSHCHRPAGPGGNFDARLPTYLLGQGIINRVPSFYKALDPDGLYIKPMDVANSIIHYRMDHALPSGASMPPVAKNVVDEAAVQVVEDWINQLNPGDFPSTPVNIRAIVGGPTTTSGDFFATILFDDDVGNLTTGDLTLTGGTLLELSGSKHYHVAKVRPTAGTVTLELPANRVTGSQTGLSNTASNTLSVAFSDNEAPSPSFIDLPFDQTLFGPINAGLDFGKNVTGLTIGDFSVTNASISNLTETNGVFHFNLTPAGVGTITLQVDAGAVMDSQSRPNPEASTTLLSALPDADNDGLPDVDEGSHGTGVNDPDSDNDGLLDGDEVFVHGSIPTNRDSDNDGYSDQAEVFAGSNPMSTSDTPTVTAPPSLVAYYNFDEGSGDVANDTATADGEQDASEDQGNIAWTTTNHLLGTASLDLSPVSSMLADTPLDGSTTAFTISVWINTDSAPAWDGIYLHRDSSNNRLWGMGLEVSHIDARANGGALDTPDAIQPNTWHHLVYMWDHSGYREVFVDGISLAKNLTAPTSFNGNTNQWVIGDDPCCNNREFDGRIDDLAVFNETLTPEQVGEIHLAGLSGLPAVNAFNTGRFAITTQSVSPDGEDLILTWNSKIGATYSVLTSTDLDLPYEDWAILYNDVSSEGLSTSFEIGMSGLPESDSRRFFVVKEN